MKHWINEWQITERRITEPQSIERLWKLWNVEIDITTANNEFMNTELANVESYQTSNKKSANVKLANVDSYQT